MFVRHVRMGVPHRRVPMAVAVFSGCGRLGGVAVKAVMAVVMAVRMFMVFIVVRMFVPVTFSQMQHDASGH